MAYVFVLTDCFFYFFDTALQFRTVVNVNMAHISAWAGIFLFFVASEFVVGYIGFVPVSQIDPIPAESFTYPEFKGYFANVQWMTLKTQEGTISICNRTPQNYVGVYQPRDGRDGLLYTFPATGISLMKVIPPVRNKVNTTDLIGPSSQAFWADGAYGGGITLKFE